MHDAKGFWKYQKYKTLNTKCKIQNVNNAKMQKGLILCREQWALVVNVSGNAKNAK